MEYEVHLLPRHCSFERWKSQVSIVFLSNVIRNQSRLVTYWTPYIFQKKMQTKDIQAAIKSKHVTQNKWLHFKFYIWTFKYVLFKRTKYTTRCSVKSSTIYKLKVILIVYFLFWKKSKSVGLIFVIVKKSLLFTQTRIHFSYPMFLSPNMLSLKKTKYTTRCSVKSSTVYKGQFILFVYFLCSKKFQIPCDRFSQWWKLVA
jgi:hypothetical protein